MQDLNGLTDEQISPTLLTTLTKNKLFLSQPTFA